MFCRLNRIVFALSLLATVGISIESADAAPVKSEQLTPVAVAQPAPKAMLGAGFPSFLLPNDVLCFDELDFNAFSKTGKFHTRGSTESCTQLTQLTRVVVLQQTGTKSKIRVVSGPLESHVGWSNGQLPFPGPKPQ